MLAGWGGRPKIVAVLAGPEGQVALQLLRAARDAGIAPTLFVGSRLPTTTYLYDDPEHPDRVTGAISSPPYTVDDQSLLIALREFEAGLCSCGFHRSVAWHPDMEGGWFEQRSYRCHACSAQRGEDVLYEIPVDVREGDLTLPPFDLDDIVVDGSPSRGRHTHRQEVDASVG